MITRKLCTTAGAFAALALSVSSASAAMVANFTFDDAGDLGANTGTVATAWNNFSEVTQTAGRFGAGAGSFVAGSSSAWDGDFSVANMESFSLSMHVKSSQANSWKDFVSIGTGNNVVFVLERTGAEGVANYNIGSVGGVNEGQVAYSPGAGTFDVDDGAWHHLGLTVGGGTLTLYIDGQNRGSAAYSGTGAMSAFQLASRFGDGDRAITTEIDDVAIFDNTLTDGEMLFLSTNAAASAVAVPEPSSAALLGLGGLALILRRRK
ncbi:LamG-like jellyroll fold domain-containing protein [Sulfuriroseicoccus oceanibius]|nr:LamG-like jellyroll fold domain-containing protein [Sulfuriroseicoccus oceanibius]